MPQNCAESVPDQNMHDIVLTEDMTTSEYVVPVDVMPDGSVWDETGRHFGCEE